MNPTQQIADAIRKVTAAVQNAIDGGRRSRAVDAYDLVEVLLAVADELDPEFPPAKAKSRKTRRSR
jgi:chorismate mutase